MEKILREIKSTKGVKAVFITNTQGQIIARLGDYPEILLKQVATEITSLLQDPMLRAHSFEGLQLGFQALQILVQAQPEFCMVCLCQPDVGLALLRMTLGLAASRVKADKKLYRSILIA